MKLRTVLFILTAGILALTVASGYLARQNKQYRNENDRLIILNDSILSENIELKNALHQKKYSVSVQSQPENIKTGKN